MNIGFIGAGKVGFSLGRYFSVNSIPITGYYSRNPQSAMDAASFTQTKFYQNMETLIDDSDVLFLTVPDSAILKVWEQIKLFQIKNKIICHCSGALSSAVFSGINQTGAFGYSIHPLFAVNDKYHSYEDLPKAFFTMEGSPEHLNLLQNLISRLGNPVKIIEPGQKISYHTAAVFSSNHVVALIEEGIRLLGKCNFSRSEALHALTPLIRSNVENILGQGTEKALTGPVERNDITTINKHLTCLDGKEKDLYLILSCLLAEIAGHKNKERDYSELKELLFDCFQKGKEEL